MLMDNALLEAPQSVDEGLYPAALWELGPCRSPYSAQTVQAHLSHGRSAVALLTRMEQRAQRIVKVQREMKWLAENRSAYAGRWIALDGDRLLAVGDTSKEVFSQLTNCIEPPLVTRIDDEALPFAGW